jgi:MFS family permease
VVFAGATVVIALVGLTVVNIPFLTVMGLGAAGTVLVAVLVALTLMDRSALRRAVEPHGREPGAVRAGVRYVRRRRDLLVPLLMMALVGTLAYEFQVTIPLLAHGAFGLGATGFGFLYASMGAGAVVAGLTVAGRVQPRLRTITIAALLFALGLGTAAASPNAVTAAVCLALAGAASVVYSSSSNATLQLRADPEMRGRVIALWIVAFMGSTPIGGPLVGWIGELLGPRAALGAGAVGCLAAAALAVLLSPAPQVRRAARARSGRRTAPARGPAG